MNKPILVKNQSEWNRLAPVLEALGVTMPQGFNYSEHVPQLPTVIRLRPNAMSWCATDVNDWARPQGETLQTVDEYLQAQEPTSAKNATVEPDYKTLYETLLQGVKDTKALCEENYKLNLGGSIYQKGYSSGLGKAIEILTDKTNVL